MNEELAGGCLCGAIRYAVRGPARQTSLCHCEDCRKASGAPVVAWTFFEAGALRWTRGEPKRVDVAERERSFCGDCGTPLMFVDPAIPEWFEVSTCSLDHPENQPPGDECWICDDLGWLKTHADLPRSSEHSPLPEVLP